MPETNAATAVRQRLEELLPEALEADHVDVKTALGRCDMRRFIAGMLSWSPGWVALLYRMRRVLAQVLRLQHADMTAGPPPRAEDIPLAPGGVVKFLTVAAARDEDHWIAWAGDRHLDGWIVVLAEALPDGLRRYQVCTVVRFRHWTGPLYFNLIRPFHHLIAAGMVRAGARAGG